MSISRVIFFILVIFGTISALQVIMERAQVLEVNHKFVEWGQMFTKRYGRKSPYYLNIEGQIKHTWSNNVTIHLVFYEYLHNEYRRSFVEMHLKFCDAVNADPYVGKMLASGGVVCPLPKGTHHIRNMTIEAKEFPNVWPFKKGKVEFVMGVTDSSETIARVDIYITFLQKKGS